MLRDYSIYLVTVWWVSGFGCVVVNLGVEVWVCGDAGVGVWVNGVCGCGCVGMGSFFLFLLGCVFSVVVPCMRCFLNGTRRTVNGLVLRTF